MGSVLGTQDLGQDSCLGELLEFGPLFNQYSMSTCTGGLSQVEVGVCPSCPSQGLVHEMALTIPPWQGLSRNAPTQTQPVPCPLSSYYPFLP